MDVLCTLIPLAFVGAVVWWFIRASAAQRSAWDALAAEHGLEVSNSRGRIRARGTIGKTHFTYQTRESSHADGGASCDVFVPIPREEMGDLEIGHEHILAKLAKALGGQDITFDDPVFDDRWRVTCRQPQIARNILTRSVRIAFHNTQTDLGSRGYLSLSKGQLVWSYPTHLAADALPKIVRTLGKCARKFAAKPPRQRADELIETESA